MFVVVAVVESMRKTGAVDVHSSFSPSKRLFAALHPVAIPIGVATPINASFRKESKVSMYVVRIKP